MGQSPETSWHMAKTGNAYLRAALYHMALVGTVHNPVIRVDTLALLTEEAVRYFVLSPFNLAGPVP